MQIKPWGEHSKLLKTCAFPGSTMRTPTIRVSNNLSCVNSLISSHVVWFRFCQTMKTNYKDLLLLDRRDTMSSNELKRSLILNDSLFFCMEDVFSLTAVSSLEWRVHFVWRITNKSETTTTLLRVFPGIKCFDGMKGKLLWPFLVDYEV